MSPLGFAVYPTPRLVSDTQIATFSAFAVANISDAMNRTNGTSQLRPYHRTGRLIGRAVTVKTAPGDNLMVHKAMDMAEPGDVILVDAGAYLLSAVVGELMSATAARKGIAGFVIDGAIRDSEVLGKGDFGVFARGVAHRGPFREGPGEVNVPICIDGMVTMPGDLIVADHDGVLAIRPSVLDTLAVLVADIEAKEKQVLQSIEDGTIDKRWIDETLRRKGVDI
jgi:regulator of RNase E activity RraA